jgi:hypothetical protein
MNAATISRKLNAAGIKKSATRKGRIIPIRSEGFEVFTSQVGTIIIQYVSHSELFWSQIQSREAYVARRDAARERILEILASSGITNVSVNDPAESHLVIIFSKESN